MYPNIPMGPAEGIDATMAVIEMFCRMCEALEFEVHHLATDGSTVLTERTDTFTMKGKTAPLPVMGASAISTDTGFRRPARVCPQGRFACNASGRTDAP